MSAVLFWRGTMGCQIVFLNEYESTFSLRNKFEDDEIRIIEVSNEQQLQRHAGFSSIDAVMVLVNRSKHWQGYKVEEWPKQFGCHLIALTTETDVQFHQSLLAEWADEVILLDPKLALLKAKCQAFTRRKKIAQTQQSKINIHSNLYMDLQLYDLVKDGKRLYVPKKEFQIIKLLVEHPTKVFSKDEIYLSVWGSHDYDDANLLNVHIRRIRSRIEQDPNRPKILLTRWGIGYQLVTT
jgi:DNA-binding response OmpR family regulator